MCDLLSHTGAMARVQVLGREIRFRVEDGIPCRVPKAWGSGGWVLDLTTLPEMVEPTVEELCSMKPADLTTTQLQVLYTHLSGRTSESTSRTYLSNRVRAAKNGTLPSGTRRSRSGEPQKVLPVAMPVSTV